MKKRYIMLVAIAALASLPCAQESSEKPEKKKVLIAFEDTRFKKSLVDEMTALLKKESVEVTCIVHSGNGLDAYDASAYDAVFITNSGVNSQVRPWVMTWVEKNSAHQSGIVLHTTQKNAWKVNAPVDAVTSASAVKEVKKYAQEYVGLLKAKFAVEETTTAPDDEE